LTTPVVSAPNNAIDPTERLVIAWLAKARGEALMQASINYLSCSNGIPNVYHLLTGL
jgi:hypothetical protein